MAARAAAGSVASTASSTGPCPAPDARRASSGPGTNRSTSPISAWIAVSARTRRALPLASATATWKRASASRKPANDSAAASTARRRPPQPGPLDAVRAQRRQRRRLAGDGAPPVGQLAQLLGRRQRPRRLQRVTGVRRHERAAAAAAPGLDEAGIAEDRERLPERHRRDLEPGRQLPLARQPLARLEHARADRLADPAHDRLHGPLDLERREHGGAGGGVHHL